jgi:GTP-binding protein LepA
LLALQERLEREYNLDLVTTAPTVVYKTLTTDGEELTVNSPGDLPDATKRQNISEPYVRLEMVTPAEYVGNLMELANNRRGEFVEMKYLTGAHVLRVLNSLEMFLCLMSLLPAAGRGYTFPVAWSM